MFAWRRLTSLLAATMVLTAWAFAAGGPSATVARSAEHKAPGVIEATSGISDSRADATVTKHALVIEAEDHDISPAVRSLPPARDGDGAHFPIEYEGVRPSGDADHDDDPVVQRNSGLAPSRRMPAPDQNFAGIGNVQGYTPPDTNGDVGPNHYVQTVNVAMRIWNKSGTPLTNVADVSTLFDGFGGICETTNQGDPIVLYDEAADRWFISQFAFDLSGGAPVAPFYQCVAISTGPNPAGTYYRYSFLSPNSRFNDYGKLGVWPDAYYMGTNEFSAAGAYVGVGAWAMDRSKMLNGQSATMQYFHLGTNSFGFIPSDADGAAAPPAGAPNPFLSFDDWSSTPRLKVYNFDVDFTTPANSTFTAAPDIVTASFDSNLCNYSACVPQPGTTRLLDAISDRLMYRLAYRNLGTHQALVVSHTVDANGSDRAGVRWYELRKTSGNWFMQQQGTYSPDAVNRFMPSAAMDGAGNIAVGYSAASGSVSPGLRYAGRLSTDPAGQLSQGESVLVAGSGSQTGGGGRWGDYSSLSVDPSDDCTFWFTSEYYTSTSATGWATRIGSFSFPGCAGQSPSSLSIDDVSLQEGNSGTTNAVFTVTLNPAQAGQTVTVNYSTGGGSATSGSDFTATSGTLTFNPNDTTESISVPVSGDTTPESNETFTVDLSNATAGITIAKNQGIGTITNDDAVAPTFSVNNASVNEGNSGDTMATFTVSLSSASGSTQTVNYATQNGTATSPSDFGAVSGILTFNPSDTSEQVQVPVHGDTTDESNETFSLLLSNGSVTISDATGSGTITDDDDPVGTCTITGTAGDDTLIGTGGDDVICGLGGFDVMEGRGGNDTIDGGSGPDRAHFDSATGPVTVNLGTGTASGAGIGTDTLISVSDAAASIYADKLIGDNGVNYFFGWSGNDVLKGNGGDDRMWGENGNDTFSGGTGIDTCTQGPGSGTSRGCEKLN